MVEDLGEMNSLTEREKLTFDVGLLFRGKASVERVLGQHNNALIYNGI
jgi:hypothetical protein